MKSVKLLCVAVEEKLRKMVLEHLGSIDYTMRWDHECNGAITFLYPLKEEHKTELPKELLKFLRDEGFLSVLVIPMTEHAYRYDLLNGRKSVDPTPWQPIDLDENDCT